MSITKKISYIFLIIISIFALSSCKKADIKTFEITIELNDETINEHGNIKLTSDSSAFENEYDFGDILKVKFDSNELYLPFIDSYNEAGLHKEGVVSYRGYVVLAVYMGDFASKYNLKADHSTMTFEFSLKEKGGYLHEYEARKLVYTFDRNDYPNLTDSEYANFRAVTYSKVKPNTLYRSSNPVDTNYGRAIYLDKCLKENNNVTDIINLANSEEEIKEFELYETSYYKSVRHYECKMSVDYTDSKSKESLKKVFKIVANNKGVYLINCNEGKDRTGFVIFVLGAISNATLEELISDYLVTYYNYYQLEENDPKYQIIENDFLGIVKECFGIEEVSNDNLYLATYNYLKNIIGLTNEEIGNIRLNLMI